MGINFKAKTPLIREFIKNKKIINQGELLSYMQSIGYKNPIDQFNTLKYRGIFGNKKIIRTLVGNKKYFSKIDKKKAQKKSSKKYYSSEKGKESNRRNSKKYYASENGKKWHSNYYDENRKEIIEKKKNYNKSEKGKKTIIKYWLSPKGPLARRRYNQSEKGKKQNNKYVRERKKRDPAFKIRLSLSNRLGSWLITKGIKKNSKTMELVGCSKEFCRKHIEKQFYPHPLTGKNMSWNNHGKYGWHIDHIIPFATIKDDELGNIEVQKKIMHYSNLQPLWAKENLKKGGR
tara:strand:- start:63 stop:929 length:867 start_codon:yes stop_codon:yes gene_type:complete